MGFLRIPKCFSGLTFAQAASQAWTSETPAEQEEAEEEKEEEEASAQVWVVVG